MAANVEPEEAQALMELMSSGEGKAPEVTERDFRRPRRLSGAARGEIQRLVQDRVPVLEEELGTIIGAACPVEVAAVCEASAEELFGESSGPLAAVRFDVAGQPGWILWENRAAVFVVEKILGTSSEYGSERRLSHAEGRILEKLLACVATHTAGALGMALEGFRVGQSEETLGNWQEGGDGADVHRLEIELACQGPDEPSTMRVYLPGLLPGGTDGPAGETSIPLPGHLAGVDVEVSARLAGCEVSLDQLLSLEEGDVIPLDARVGEGALVTVEGQLFARASLGRRRDRLAIRIESLEGPPEDPQ